MKLRYYYGCMNSMKSSTLLLKAHQFEQSGCRVLLFKPAFDKRDFKEIRSRAIKYGRECFVFSKDESIRKIVLNALKTSTESEQKYTVLFFDEVNFMAKQQIRELWLLTRELNIDIFCYGLKLSYNNRLFEGAEELLILADTVEEIKSMCSRCNNKAQTHLRIVNGEPVFGESDEILGDIIGIERYESVCTSCWMKEYDKSFNNISNV